METVFLETSDREDAKSELRKQSATYICEIWEEIYGCATWMTDPVCER